MKAMALLSTLLCLAVIIAYFLHAPAALVATLFSLAVMAGGALLLHGLMVLRKTPGADVADMRKHGSAHIVSHIVPVIYLASLYFGVDERWLDIVFLFLFAFFFYTGKMMWKSLYGRFGNRMYGLFALGNRGMLSAVFVSTALDLVLRERIGFSLFDRLLPFYLAIHFLLLGVSVLQVDKSIRETQS